MFCFYKKFLLQTQVYFDATLCQLEISYRRSGGMWRLRLPDFAVIWIWIFRNTAVKNFVPLGLTICQRVSFIFMAVWPSVIFLAEWRRHVAAGVWTAEWTSWCCSCESMHENSTGQLTVAVPNWYTNFAGSMMAGRMNHFKVCERCLIV